MMAPEYSVMSELRGKGRWVHSPMPAPAGADEHSEGGHSIVNRGVRHGHRRQACVDTTPRGGAV
jgi:hypothetical protein